MKQIKVKSSKRDSQKHENNTLERKRAQNQQLENSSNGSKNTSKSERISMIV